MSGWVKMTERDAPWGQEAWTYWPGEKGLGVVFAKRGDFGWYNRDGMLEDGMPSHWWAGGNWWQDAHPPIPPEWEATAAGTSGAEAKAAIDKAREALDAVQRTVEAATFNARHWQTILTHQSDDYARVVSDLRRCEGERARASAECDALREAAQVCKAIERALPKDVSEYRCIKIAKTPDGEYIAEIALPRVLIGSGATIAEAMHKTGLLPGEPEPEQ